MLRTRVLCSAFFCVVRREISKFKHIIVSFESFCAQIRARKDRKIQRVEFQDQTSKTPLFCTKHLENYENKVIWKTLLVVFISTSFWNTYFSAFFCNKFVFSVKKSLKKLLKNCIFFVVFRRFWCFCTVFELVFCVGH